MKQKKKKALVLSLTMAALLLTGGLNAQERRGGLFGFNGLFSSWDENEEDIEGMMNRGDFFANANTGNIGVGSFDAEDPNAPLGSGLLILTATGIGYALLKKKEEKK